MKRPLVVLCAAAATLFAASAAEAARVNWSVGINVPPVATYVSGGPAYYPAPVRYVPPAVVYEPAPVYAPGPDYADPYVDGYAVAPLSVYAAPAPAYFHRPHVWLPRLPAPRWGRDGRWDRDDRGGQDSRGHRDGDHRR